MQRDSKSHCLPCLFFTTAESSAPQQQSYQTTSLATQTQPQAGSAGQTYATLNQPQAGQTYATQNQPQAGQTYATQNQPQAGSTGQTYPQTQLYQPVAPHGTSKTIIGYYGEHHLSLQRIPYITAALFD